MQFSDKAFVRDGRYQMQLIHMVPQHDNPHAIKAVND